VIAQTLNLIDLNGSGHQIRVPLPIDISLSVEAALVSEHLPCFAIHAMDAVVFPYRPPFPRLPGSHAYTEETIGVVLRIQNLWGAPNEQQHTPTVRTPVGYLYVDVLPLFASDCRTDVIAGSADHTESPFNLRGRRSFR
jgi:hypothetical protein